MTCSSDRQKLDIVGVTVAVIVSCLAGPASADLLSGEADAVLGPLERTVLEATADRTVVQITFPVLEAPASWQTAQRIDWRGIGTEMHDPETREIVRVEPLAMFQVALDQRRLPSWRVAAVQWYRAPSDPAAAPANVSGPAVYRGVPLAQVTIHPEAGGGALAGLVIEINHPAGRATAPDAKLQRRADREPLPATIVNAPVFRDLRARAMTQPAPDKRLPLPDYFGLTSNWVRLRVDQTGVFELSGRDLETMGVLLATVDPTKLRLYKGGGLTLDDNPEVTEDEQPERAGLTEVAITVEDGGDGEFDADDRIIFYGLSTELWLDRLVPGADPVEYYEHPYESHGIYWLTYEDIATSSPLPGTPSRVVTVAAVPTGAPEIDTHRARFHGEQNRISDAGYVRDNWVWNATINSAYDRTFDLEGAVSGEQADWNVDVVAHFVTRYRFIPAYETSAWLNDDTANTVDYSWTYLDQEDVERIRIAGVSDDVRALNNTIKFRFTNYNDTDRTLMGYDSFDVRYTASLDKRDYAGALTCVFWGDEVTVPATASDLRFTLPATGAVTVWDVSAPHVVAALAGDETAGDPRNLSVGIVRDPGISRHLIVFDDGDLLPVADGARVDVTPLRETVQAADYIVVHLGEYGPAADALVALRSQQLPGVESPRAIAVSTEDIYANFSGGQKDWRAIRQFLRWHYQTYEHSLRWVCLLGDASRDYRNYLDFDPRTALFDRVPTSLETEFPWDAPLRPTYINYPYVADDALVMFDAPPPTGSVYDMPDVAVGRLPANSLAEAMQLVNRVRDFETDRPDGNWSNEAVFCADDLYQGSNGGEYYHTAQAEILANDFLAPSVDIDKVYLLNYPLVGSYKPDARRALLAELNDGASIFYYVGHGSPEVLADEQVFRIDDIPGLTNADRRFMFMAFSCDVGVFDDPHRQCMGEDFVTATQGGAITTVTASWVSYIHLNNALSSSFCEAMYPNRHVEVSTSVGESLIIGKIDMYPNYTYVANARRYNVLGDPAIRVPNPVDNIAFAAGSADSLLTGRLHDVRLDLTGADVSPGADTTYRLRVQESGVEINYYGSYDWLRLGNDAFRGSGSVLDDDTGIPFVAPVSLRTGPTGRFRCIVEGDDGDHVAISEVPVELVAASTDDIIGPSINLSFPNGRTRVRQGETLTAALNDTSGVNILASTPANSVLLEFDRSNIFTNVSGDVVFDSGSYSRATLMTALPADLELGRHSVVMTASDMFGNVGRDTLNFELEAASVASMRDVTVFPNPTPGPNTRLIADLSVGMDLQWDIYTVSGRRVRSIRSSEPTAGPAIIEWDGRDGEGDEIANGVYLYVLRGWQNDSGGEWLGADADPHGFRQTGQLVIMR